MPVINQCSVESCAYNQEKNCHAMAITIGDPQHAHCDTFLSASSRGGAPSITGKVGACKMSDCRHNVDFECQAPAITVGQRIDEADCLTYETR